MVVGSNAGLDTEADLGKSMLVHWPIASLMDFISYVETCRDRLQMRSRSLALPQSACTCTEQELCQMNWALFSGQKGLEAVKEFTTVLLAPPSDDIYEACNITFASVLPHVFPTMCDTWRRLWLPAQKKKTQLLGVGLMTLEQATSYFKDLAKLDLCCGGDPFVQVRAQESRD